MKIQDITFLIILIGLVIMRRPRIAVLVGVFAILLSVPLFHLKIGLFTAQRLVMYASAFFLVTVVFHVYNMRPTKHLS